jgi:hypothetical protein
MDPTQSSAATAAGIAADYSARATYARGYEDGQAAEKTRADEMEAVAERWEDRYYKMCSEVNAAEARTDELGIQLAALQERLRLAMAVVEAARHVLNEVLAAIDDDDGHDEPWFTCPRDALQDAMLALDRIPGDALPHGALASSGRLDTTDARWVGPDGEPER